MPELSRRISPPVTDGFADEASAHVADSRLTLAGPQDEFTIELSLQ